MARDNLEGRETYQVIGGYVSPVNDAYQKNGLASAAHRVKMCEMAVQDSDWIAIDGWESSQSEWTPTAEVLESFKSRLDACGYAGVCIKLVAGADLIESFQVPDLWSDADLDKILGDYGVVVVERWAADFSEFLLTNPILFRHRRNIITAKQYISNDISSTKIRLFLRRGLSVKYLLPDAVLHYIKQHSLYLEEE